MNPLHTLANMDGVSLILIITLLLAAVFLPLWGNARRVTAAKEHGEKLKKEWDAENAKHLKELSEIKNLLTDIREILSKK